MAAVIPTLRLHLVQTQGRPLAQTTTLLVEVSLGKTSLQPVGCLALPTTLRLEQLVVSSEAAPLLTLLEALDLEVVSDLRRLAEVCLAKISLQLAAVCLVAAAPPTPPRLPLVAAPQTPAVLSVNRTLAAADCLASPTTRPLPLRRLVPTTLPQTLVVDCLAAALLVAHSGRTTRLLRQTRLLVVFLVVVGSVRTTSKTSKNRAVFSVAQALAPQEAVSLVARQTRVSLQAAACLETLLQTTIALEVDCSAKSLQPAVLLCSEAAMPPPQARLEVCSEI